MLNSQKVQSFRGDFEKAVAQLEKKLWCYNFIRYY